MSKKASISDYHISLGIPNVAPNVNQASSFFRASEGKQIKITKPPVWVLIDGVLQPLHGRPNQSDFV